ncbi:hypothetical protein [Flavobacterium luteum]|uniref:Uncharacterized protein n=1 Tax=Flavobacterium luteum TaxID=2026654 RepID=A0A7J5ABA9_9FLAO|nr:hypothetical protein [Flavobacterium luteum]KAB1154852.1 hypothetical protein F6464_12470 [Flavobacterium luteum]
MKKITLLVAAILLFGNVAKASAIINYSGEKTNSIFNLNDPIEFTERGITFYVFPNGEFDFNTTQSQGNSNYYRRGINIAMGAPGVRNIYSSPNNAVRIEHDAMGRIRRIGNVFVNYDYLNRIKRIGTIYMSYNRFALDQIGGLRIFYNKRGQIINTFGSVKGYTSNYYYNSQYESNNNCDTSSENQDNTNDQMYYRKRNPNSDVKRE